LIAYLLSRIRDNQANTNKEIEMQTATIETGMDPLLAEMIAAGLISPDDAQSASSLSSGVILSDDEALSLTESIEEEETRRSEAYEAQSADFGQAGMSVLSDEEIAGSLADGTSVEHLFEAPATTGKALKRSAKAKTSKAPREARVTDDATYIASIAGGAIILDSDLGETVNTVDLINSIKAVKIREKSRNLFDAIKRKKNVSTFTGLAFEHLMEHKTLTAQALVHTYQSHARVRDASGAYSLGTARSQSQQMAALFKTLKITDAVGNINPNSTLLQEAGYKVS
jgi:hypothetical protein